MTVSTAVAADKKEAQSALFTRQSSGLVRELGIPSAIGIALASVVVVNTFINFFAGLAGFKQADMVIPLIAGALIWVVAMFAYKSLLDAIPRAGGEYVYLSRIISPAIGSMAGLSLAVAFLFFLGSNANFVAQYLPFTLLALGSALGSSSIANAGSQIGGTGAIAVISVCILLFLGICSTFSVKRVAQAIMALVVVQLLAYLTVLFLLVTHSHDQFVAAFAAFSNHPNAYNDVLAAAAKDSIPLGVSTAASLAVIPFMVLNYNGALYAYYVAGELKKPGRTYLWASTVTIALLAVVWIAGWVIMLNTIGRDFMQAQAQLGVSDPTAYGAITSLQASTNGLGYGLVLSGDPVTKLLIGVAIPFASFALELAFVVVVTRVLFALAFDRLLPVALAEVTDKGVPRNAIVVCIAGAIAFTLLNAFGTLTAIVANLSLFVALILLAGSIAAFALPLRRPDLVMRPGAQKLAKVGGLPIASLPGAAAAILALITIALIIGNPSVFGSFSVVSVGALVVIIAAGPIVYLIARQMRLQRSSIDIGLAMHDLPPE